MDSSSEGLCFRILNSNEAVLEKIECDSSRSRLIPFRFIEVKTQRIKDVWQISAFNSTHEGSTSKGRPKYGILSHVWYGGQDREVTWDKLKNSSVGDLERYYMGLEKIYNQLESTWKRSENAEGKEAKDLSSKFDILVSEIDKTFGVQLPSYKGEGRWETIESIIKDELSPRRSLGKIAQALKAARDCELEYLWVDTCCMNKSNSTELMESLACMGDWYSNAEICLVYFDDYKADSFPNRFPVSIAPVRWSTRGWTLQEIAMCKEVAFYNIEWKYIPHNDIYKDIIYQICNVPEELFCKGGKIQLAAAYIMHYAGTRQTTRGEDRAYSLMGMLGVKIPIMYGEGEEVSLSRLIDEVIRSKGDVSVFRWAGINSGSNLLGKSMYPTSLSAFPECPQGRLKPLVSDFPVTMSNAGVNTTFEILPVYPAFEHPEFPGGLVGLLEELEKNHKNITECIIPCRGMMFWDDWEAYNNPCNIRCPLSVLRREAEYLRGADRPKTENENVQSLPGSWVLARTIGSGGTGWFFCLLASAPGLGYFGWRIPSDQIKTKDRIVHPDHRIQICVR